MKDVQARTLAELAAPIRGIRVLLFGFSGRGFPGGDGVAEAVDVLPAAGIEATYTHDLDPDLGSKLEASHDVAIVCNTRIGALLQTDRRLWDPRRKRVLWFWDLRPGSVGAPLRGMVDRVFLAYSGRWTSPEGMIYDPLQWSRALGCPVGYAPQASPLRTPVRGNSAPRVVFVGDLGNRTYHYGRRALCVELGATVVNAKPRDERLAIEARLPTLYPSARYVLSTSPLAPGYTSVRTYSILACGGLMLLHRFPGAERLFRDGEHAVMFDSAPELADRLKGLDQDADTRLRIAEAGRLLHAERHTVAHRIVSICREVTGKATGFSGWLPC